MRKSDFNELTKDAIFANTKTLTKVTMPSVKTLHLLLSALKLEETEFKLNKETRTVTIKTNLISSYLDLADKIMTPSKTSTPKFGKFVVENSWKIRTYFIGDVKIATNSKPREITVRYASSSKKVQCRWVSRSDSVSDMGTVSGVSYMMLQFRTTFLGKAVWIDSEQFTNIYLDLNEFKKYVAPIEGTSTRPKRKRSKC